MAEEVPGGEGNLNFDVKPTPVTINEYKDAIEAALLNRHRAGYDTNVRAGDNDATVIEFIRATLRDNNAIIAGGFLLNVINPFVLYPGELVDIDCYVPCKNLVLFNKTMVKLTDAEEFREHRATMYCSSFLRKNGIRTVQGFFKKLGGVGSLRKHLMDIMAVRNSRSPLDVVQNFDLTFCQVWYDGENVWTTHPSNIKEKRGVLQKDYVPVLLNGNTFLKNRISKYTRRGYSITLDKNYIDKIVVNPLAGLCKSVNKDDNYYKKWVTRALLHVIVSGGYVSENRLTKFTDVFNLDITTTRKYLGFKEILDPYKVLPLATMDPLGLLDGYDTDDYDITNRDTFNTILDKHASKIPDTFRPDWIALSDEVKFWNCVTYMKELFYSLDRYKNPFGLGYRTDLPWRRDDMRRVIIEEVNLINKFMTPDPAMLRHGFNPYSSALVYYAQRFGDDAISLDDGVPVYDLHNHGLDTGIGREGLKMHLDPLIGQRDKSALPCYVTGCTWPLKLDEIMPIVGADYYITFTEPIVDPLPPPSPLLGTGGLGQTLDPATNETIDLIDIIRDEPSDAGGWSNIYHMIICPFCLGYMSREEGCTYITHPNPEGLPYAFMPYCRPQNVVQVIKSKYTAFPSLEVCAQCGRPCTGHEHFDLADPPGMAPPLLTAAGTPDYERCGGGGRREGIARIIGVRDTVIANPGMDPDELRTLAALAAEAAASDPAILTRADTILARAPDTRLETNLDGGGRVGKVCGHGYGSYKAKIKMTRKRKQKKGKKGSRKN